MHLFYDDFISCRVSVKKLVTECAQTDRQQEEIYNFKTEAQELDQHLNHYMNVVSILSLSFFRLIKEQHGKWLFVIPPFYKISNWI